MSEEKIVNNYYQTNIKTSRNEDSVYAMKYASQQMLIDKLQQENQQLKEQYCERTDCVGRLGSSRKVERYKQVLDEIREFIKKCSFSIEGITNEYHDIVYAEDIEEILDKVNSEHNSENV